MKNKTIQSLIVGALLMVPGLVHSQSVTVPDIYGSVIFGMGWEHMENAPYGIYSIREGNGMNPQTEVLDNKLMVNGGGTYVDGKYYLISFVENEIGYEVFYRVYDVENGWKQKYEKKLSSVAGIATDMTYNPVDDKIYGCFWNSTSGQGKCYLGTLDELTGEARKIAPLKERLMTISANREGELYGVGEFGMFYKINSKTAELMQIGPTGKTIRYDQSATFDYSTGKLYWVMTPDDFMSEVELCEINITNGSVKKISQVPNRYEFTGIFTKQPFTLPDAAGRVTDVWFDYPQGAAEGSIVFTLPSVTFAGKPMTGNVDYTVIVDGEMVKQDKQEVGTQVRVKKDMPAGMHVVKISVENSKGRSPVFIDWVWAGVDIPKALNPAFTVDGTKAEVTWKAPEKGINGGYINPDKVSYKVVRRPDRKTVYEGKSTQCTDDLTDIELNYYWYEVTALHDGKTGKTVSTDKQLLGDAIICPYRERFASEEDFQKFTVLDANEDKCTWHWEDGMATYDWNENGIDADDWLITPPVKFQQDRVYILKYEVVTVPNYVETLGVSMGVLPTVEGMKEEILPPSQFGDSNNPVTEHIIVAKENRNVCLGFHALSKAKDAAYLHIDNITVEDVAHAKAPQKSEFTVEPGVKGTKTATIRFSLPTKNISGEKLNSIEGLQIYRDNQLIEELDGLKPGDSKTVVDDKPTRGKHVYKLIAINEHGNGLTSEQGVFVGEDAPGPVENIRMIDLGAGSVQLTWEAPTVGLNGGYVNPENLSYVVYNIGRKSGANKLVYETTLTDKLTLTDDMQKMAWYQIEAKNTYGTSVKAESDTIFLGTPYPLPFKESFARRAFQRGPWRLGTDTKSAWDVMQFGTYADPQDADDGLAVFMVTKGPKGEASLVSPKIAMKGAKNPILSFWVWHSTKADNRLSVVAVDAEGERHLLKEINQQEETIEAEGGEWIFYELELQHLNTTEFIQLHFEGKNITAEYDMVNVLYLDNILLTDVPAYDIAVLSLQADKKDVEVGSKIEFTGIIQNLGYKKVEKYTVRLKRDGKEIAAVDFESLAAGQTEIVKLADIPNIDAAKVSNYTMVVEVAQDENLSNNESELCAIAIIPGKPYVDDLTAALYENHIKLTWSCPEGTATPTVKEVTEGFEDYEAFRIKGIGEWTLVDADGRNTAGVQDGSGDFIQYPNVGSPMAYQVFNPSKAGLSGNDWSCHGGSQVLAAFTCQYTSNDDWLISPRIAGKQTISFWAKSAASSWYDTRESIEVYYSTGGTDLSDFQKTGNTITVPSSWKNYTADLPEGTTHFAIRCVSNNQFVLFVDDITYTPQPRDFQLLGYNVYRNGEKINAELLTETAFVDTQEPASKTDNYYVTVVYNIGESVPSNVVSLESVDIDKLVTSCPMVYSVEGGLSVVNSDNMLVHIYSIDGRLIYSFYGDSFVRLPMGSYIVCIGQKSIKSMVR